MQDPDGPAPGITAKDAMMARASVPYGERENPWEGSERPTHGAKTMIVRFKDGSEASIRQGTIHLDSEHGWTTVVTDQDEVELRAPSSLIEAFSITVS